MTDDDSDRVRGIFSARASDLTPTSARHAAHVVYMPVASDPAISKHCALVLSEAERIRAQRFAAKDDRSLFEQRRAFRRFCATLALKSSRPLSEIRFANTENGRPFLVESPDLWFSFSSCRTGLLAAWSSTRALGIDIEDPTRELEALDLARRYFAVAEAEAIEAAVETERLATFYRFWTLKEAALKSIGEGLPFGLDSFEVVLEPGPKFVRAPLDRGGHAGFNGWVIERTDSVAALVTHRLA